MFGFLNIIKPAGPTSHDMVDRVRRTVGRGVKVGHCGTLDPFASGVLVVCIGQATRLADYVQSRPKRYVAQITLGATSDTDDSEGAIVAGAPVPCPPDEAAVRQALLRFVGEIQQTPPAHSAVHVDGKRAYSLARKGQQMTLAPRAVHVHAIDLVEYRYPLLTIDVRCGGGTYIRAIARDVGAALGVGGYCSQLQRTEVGPFKLADATTAEQLDTARHLQSPLLAVAEMPQFGVDHGDTRHIAMGQRITLPQTMQPGSQCAAVSQTGELVAIGEVQGDGATFRPHSVFVK